MAEPTLTPSDDAFDRIFGEDPKLKQPEPVETDDAFDRIFGVPAEEPPVKEEPPRKKLDPGFQYVDEPSQFITLQSGDINPITGRMKARIFYTEEEIRRIEDSKTSPEARYATITARMTEDQKDLMKDVSAEELEEDWLQTFLGAFNWAASPLQLPQSGSWTATAAAAQLLPNPGETFLGVPAGDLAESSFVAVYPYLFGQGLSHLAVAQDQRDSFGLPSVKPESLKEQEEAAELFEEAEEAIGRNIYDAWATGKVYENILSGTKYEGTVVDAFDIFTEVPMARGSEVLDTLISKEEAQNLSDLARKAGKEDIADYYGLLTTELSREVIGTGAEMLFDPLWFFGMAKGAKMVTVAGVKYTLHADGVKALDALTSTGKSTDEAAEILVGTMNRNESSMDALKGVIEKEKLLEMQHAKKASDLKQLSKTPDKIIDTAKADIAAQQKIIDDAIKQAKAAKPGEEQSKIIREAKFLASLEKAKVMQAKKIASISDPVAATKYVNSLGIQEASLSGMYKKRVADMSRLLEEGYDASKHIQTAGAFRFHVPFTSKTYNVGQSTFKITPLQDIDTAQSIASRTVGNVDDLTALNKTTEEGLNAMIRNGERITVGIGGGGIKGLMPEPIISKLQAVTNPLQTANINNIRSKVINAGNSTKDLTKGEKFLWYMAEKRIVGTMLTGQTPLWAFDQLMTLIGTRTWEPLLAGREAKAATQYFRMRGVDTKRLANFMSGRTKMFIRLQKTSPKLWDDYQNALYKYTSALDLSGKEIMRDVLRLSDIASDIAKARIAAGTAEAGLDGQRVLNDAAMYREQGRIFPPDMKPLRESMLELSKNIQKKTGKEAEEVNQALQNIARFAAGDPQAVRDLSAQINTLKTELSDVIKVTIGKQEKELARLKKLKKQIPKKGTTVKAYTKQIKDLEAQEKRLQKVLDNYRKTIRKLPEDTRFTGALKESIDKVRTKTLEIRELEQELLRQQPKLVAKRFEVKKGQHYVRVLEKWEEDLWKGYENLRGEYTQEEMLTAVLGVFQRGEGEKVDFADLAQRFRGTKAVTAGKMKVPALPTSKELDAISKLERQLATAKTSKSRKNIQARIDAKKEQIELAKKVPEGGAQFPSVIGKRFEEVPEDIKPLVDELDRILDSYTELYRDNGFDFLKSPTDIMEVFGVMKYVPHLRHNKATDITTKQSVFKLSGLADIEKMTAGGTDEVLTASLTMDAAKQRSIAGSIDEINQLVRYTDDQWEFTINPQLLHARLMQSSKGVASEVMLSTFLRTGVVRVFSTFEEARASGFVPLLDRSYRDFDTKALLFGSAEELIDAAGRTADPIPFLEELMKLGKEHKEGPFISWAQEIKDFKNMALVEQSVGIIRGIQAKALEGAPSLNRFLIDGELLNVEARWTKLGNAKHEAYLKKMQDEYDEIAKRIDDANIAGKRPTKRDSSRYVRLEQELDPTSDVYIVNEKRIRNSVWQDVSDEINELLSDIGKGEYPELKGIKDVLIEMHRYRTGMEPLTAKDLKLYFNSVDPVARLYIPETIQENFRMMMTRTWVGEPGTFAHAAWKVARRTNNYWKMINTIISPMFTTRNVIGNKLSNMVDVGVYGTLNPITNITAGQISVLIDYFGRYGSLEKATKALRAARKPGESAIAYGKRVLKATELKKFWKGKASLVDLGDGVVRTWDEALSLMEKRGVVSGTDNYRLDYDSRMEELLEAQHKMSMAEVEGVAYRKAKKVYSKIEDFAIVATSALATGGIPIAMTKQMGETLARRAENHGRAVNFIANLKRGGTVDDAVRHVQKFLFDYNDLTPRQKDYLRVLNPFFTWNHKNFLLQTEMMTKNPLFYVNMNRFFYQTLPMITAIQDAEEKGYSTAGDYEQVRGDIMKRVRYYPDYKMYRIRVEGTPLGLPKGYDIEGFGLPIESWGEYMQAIKGLTESKKGAHPMEPVEDLAARTHWVLRALYMSATDRDPFYGEDLFDIRMRDANNAINLLHTMRQYPVLTPAAEYLNDAWGVKETTDSFGTNYWFDHDTTMFRLQRYLPNPIERPLREAATFQDVAMKMTLTPEGKFDESVTPERLSFGWRAANALLGIKLKQQATSPYLEQRWYEQAKNFQLDEMAAIGLSFKKEKTKVKD